MRTTLQPGTVAICNRNWLGLITRVLIPRSPSGKIVYEGVHLGIGRVGQEWSSVAPTRVCHVNELTEIGKENKKTR